MPSCCEIEEVHPISAMKSADGYKILEQYQQDEKGATVYKAQYIKREPEVFSGKVLAIKVFKHQRFFDNVLRMSRDIERSKLSDHKNVTKLHCTFVHDDGDIWVVMPYEHVTSLARLVAARRSSGGGGLAEREVGFLLREVLEGLDYLHERGWMHKGFDVSHIFVDTVGAVRIDFDSLSYDPDGMFEAEAAAVWPAHPPEFMREEGLEMKSDIWGFGIVALRLALGYVPATSYEELAAFLAGWPEMVEKESKEEAKVVKKERTLTTLFRKFGCFSGGSSVKEDKEADNAKVLIISPAFVKMVADCLIPEPEKRPSTKQLMECEFIRELQCQKTPVMASLLK